MAVGGGLDETDATPDVSLVTLAWKHFSRTDIEEYAALTTNSRRRALAALVLGYNPDPDVGPHKRRNTLRQIVIDMVFYALEFALDEIRLTTLKTSAFVSILLELHFWRVAHPFLALDRAFAYFTQLMLRHSADRSPHSAKVFNLFDVRAITRYVTDTYFRNYHLYTAVFCPVGEVNIAPRAPLLQVPPQVPGCAQFREVDQKEMDAILAARNAASAAEAEKAAAAAAAAAAEAADDAAEAAEALFPQSATAAGDGSAEAPASESASSRSSADGEQESNQSGGDELQGGVGVDADPGAPVPQAVSEMAAAAASKSGGAALQTEIEKIAAQTVANLVAQAKAEMLAELKK